MNDPDKQTVPAAYHTPPDSDPAASVGDRETRADTPASVGDQVTRDGAPPTPPPLGLPDVPGYAVVREVARGGMGVVYLAHDPAFGRDVAVKVMHPGQSAERFVVESKVTAQLPHPGIPPVYALGELADGRPFLAMKLVEGRTLADDLKAAPPGDRPRLLAAFESICQTVGFAHSRGIVHRDLKPANVMVGSFGEVLVMDWGLAKRAGRGGRAEGTPLPAAPGGESGGDLETVGGRIKGTPAYMAPEQARGEEVDARADVFALGGILTAALTGRAPFGGTTVMDTVRKAATADLSDALARLDACGADAELVAVAKRCLGPVAADRYADGREVAAAVAAYRAGVDERLRTAERERAAAEARAAEQRKKRRAQLALAVAVFLLLSAAAGLGWAYDRQARERKAVADRARQGVENNRRLADDLRRQYRFPAAKAALDEAAELAKSGPPELAAEVEQAHRDLAVALQLDDVRFRKWTCVVRPGVGPDEEYHRSVASTGYRAAFRQYGLDLTTADPAEAAARMSASAVRAELVAGADDWALFEPDAALRDRLLSVTRRADPGPWLDRLRDASRWADKAAVEKLAADADPTAIPSTTLAVLVELMKKHKLDPTLLLETARVKSPTDFELAFALGFWYTFNTEGGKQLGPYEAARALRPENPTIWNNLGVTARERGDTKLGVMLHREAVRRSPGDAPLHRALGNALVLNGEVEAALVSYRESIRLEAADAQSHYVLGAALSRLGRWDEAVAAFREAVRQDPKHAAAHGGLGSALRAKGDAGGAAVALREAVRHDPEDAASFAQLGELLRGAGDLTGARAALTEAARLDKQWAGALAALPPALPVAPPPRPVNP